MVVHMDFVALGADDHGGLGSLNDGFGGGARGAVVHGSIHHAEGAVVGGLAERARGFGLKLAGISGVADGQEEVCAALVFARVFLEGEGVARSQATHVAAAFGGFKAGLDFLEAHLGPGLAVAGLVVFAGVVEEGEIGVVVPAAEIVVGLEGFGRGKWIVVGVLEGGGLNFPGQGPIEDILGRGAALGSGTVSDFFVAFGRLMAGGVIAQDEHMALLVVLEEVVNAFLLQEAADEVEVSLAVLDAVFPGGVLAFDAPFKVGELIALEDVLDDLGDGLFLVDAAVGGAGEEPQPGNYGGLVTAEAMPRGELNEAADVAMEAAFAAAPSVQAEGDGLADEGVEVEVVVGADEFGLELEQAADGFLAGEADKAELVLAERGVNRDEAAVLGDALARAGTAAGRGGAGAGGGGAGAWHGA